MDHTPTPWIMKRAIGLGTISTHFIGETVDGKRTPFQALKEEDAAYIVLAVNCHEDLLKELRLMVIQKCGDADDHICGACRMAKLAIAKAEGK